jgi:hypothetical protein
LTVLIGCSLILAGCATSRVIIHPIEKSDIFSIPAKATVHISKGTIETDPKTGKIVFTHTQDKDILVEKQGWFLSDEYVEEVSQARFEK